jgi:hypothetical protein
MRHLVAILGVTLIVAKTSVSRAQEQAPETAASDSPSGGHSGYSGMDTSSEANAIANTPNKGGTGLVRRFVNDQQDIWTSPVHLRFSDMDWLAPLGGVTAGLVTTDRDFSMHLSQNPTTMSHYKTLSNAGVGALIGGASGMWLLGHVSHNQHWSETGFLAGEATLNSLGVVEGLKYSLRRERPFQGDGSGALFQSGGTSFPSEHAAAAWSVAGVIAHEYPGPFTKIIAYGLASLVDVSRVRSRHHFPSDVLVGSVIGNLVAQNIYNRHHDFNLRGGEWRSVGQIFRSEIESPGNQGSPYVPLDSWIYPALDRLAAMGFIDSGFAGLRPWTRSECGRLLAEADEKADSGGDKNAEATKLLASLEHEFHLEVEGSSRGVNHEFVFESVYTRQENISGQPLNDGYHFAQTLSNDFGRPYTEGWNTVTGFSTYGTAGRWVGYFRGEWQTAPSNPPLPFAARQTIQQVDFLPQLPPGTATPAQNQFVLLDSYVGLMLSDWQISFGRQSLWWGPGNGGPMMLSDNPAPLNMIRINRVSPLKLPGILGWLGPMRVEFFLGQLRGQFFENNSHGITGNFFQPLNPQPYIHGEKIDFKPTPNFEFGLARNAIFGGPSTPFTTGLFLRSLLPSLSNSDVTGSRSDSGDQQSELDWSYRLPKLRNWLSFYGDAFADDEISPIAYWDRSAIHAGLYLSHVPSVPKLDLRAEGVYTDLPPGGNLGHGFFYYSTLVQNGQTSEGYLLGSWIGRQGQGAQAWTNYWFNSRNRLQFNFRHQKVSQQFIPRGGTLTDVGARTDYWITPSFALSAVVQYERWTFPLIRPSPSRDVTASVEVLIEPQKLFRRAPTRQQGSASTGDKL